MISDEKLQKALTYLAETDEPCANAKALLVGLEKQEKTIIAVEFASGQGGVEERKQAAYRSQSYKDWQEKLQNAVADYETMRNRRLTAELIVEVYRTESANRRRGNV